MQVQTIEPEVIDFFAKMLSDARLKPNRACIAANMFGRWHSQQDEPVCMEEEADLYGIKPVVAFKIWEAIADEFDLKMTHVQGSRCSFYIVRAER